MALPAIDLTDSSTLEEINTRAVELKKTLATATAELTRKRQAWMGEGLVREGLPTPAAVLANAVRCIFGLGSSNNSEGCSEPATFSCPTCQAICCDFHQEHSRHEVFVNESVLLKQQQALAQRQAISRSAVDKGDVETVTGDKVPRKNTWDDLKARYKKIKGTDYERQKGHLKADFQLMVEGLEGREKRGTQAEKVVKQSTITLCQPSITSTTSSLPSKQTPSESSESQQYQEFIKFQQFQEFMRNQYPDSSSAAPISCTSSDDEL